MKLDYLIIQVQKALSDLLKEELNFFSSMKSKVDLGKIIETANQENDYIKKAEKFLLLINKENEKGKNNKTTTSSFGVSGRKGDMGILEIVR